MAGRFSLERFSSAIFADRVMLWVIALGKIQSYPTHG
jgi:hypothetical protein